MTERPIEFGEDARLAGTVLVPSAGTPANCGLGLILLNAGIVPRVGPHRINVKLARKAATLGIPSIRFDLAGRGDSRPGGRQLDYRQQAVADLRAALQTLEDVAGTRRYLVFGICSGADDALAAALVEPKIAAAVLFDPYVYPTLRWRWRIATGKLRKFGLLGSLARWRSMRRQRRSGEAALQNFGRDVPSLQTFAGDLASLAARGAQVHLVYSASSVDQCEYEAQVKVLLADPAVRLRVESVFLPDVDHVVTSLAAQERLLSLLEGWIRPVAGTGPTDGTLNSFRAC